jgi:heterodisulfide reductase subunit B
LKKSQVTVGSAVDVHDLASFFGQSEWLEKIRSLVQRSLEAIKAVCYYGCMANRPPVVTGSTEYENPSDMDNIATVLGVDVQPWSYKTDCCGASFSVSRQDIVFNLASKLYDKALEAGAECIIVSCQMCQANLDMYQEDISSEFGKDYHIPVFYFTELIGLALGLEDVSKWLKRHMANPIPFLKEKGLLN